MELLTVTEDVLVLFKISSPSPPFSSQPTTHEVQPSNSHTPSSERFPLLTAAQRRAEDPRSVLELPAPIILIQRNLGVRRAPARDLGKERELGWKWWKG